MADRPIPYTRSEARRVQQEMAARAAETRARMLAAQVLPTLQRITTPAPEGTE